MSEFGWMRACELRKSFVAETQIAEAVWAKGGARYERIDA